MPSVPACDEDLVRRLPLPLAQLYRRAHNARAPLERHQAAFYLWEAAVKLLGATAIVAYADLNAPDPDCTERLKNLARPALGHWWEFVRCLVPVLAKTGDARYRELNDLLLGRARSDLAAAAGLDAALREKVEEKAGAGSVRPRDLFDRLVRYRNDEVGHGALGMARNAYYERMGDLLLGGVAELLGRIDVLAGRRLLYVSEVRRGPSGAWVVGLYELVGETVRRIDGGRLDSAGVQDLLPNRLYVLHAGEGAAFRDLRSLHPLLIYDEDTRKVYFLNAQRGGQRTEYLDYVDNTVLDRDDLAEALRDMMGRVLGAPAEALPQEARPETIPDERRGDGPPVEAATDRRADAAPGTPEPAPDPVAGLRIALLYKRNAQPDEHVLGFLEKELSGRGARVFVDRHLAVGVEWAKELERRVREADAVIPLLSAAAAESEMLAYELQIAHDEAEKRRGKPRILPVRVRHDGTLPRELADILDRLQYFLWKGPEDDARLLRDILASLDSPSAIKKAPPPTGVLPLDSPYYVVRPTDAEFQAAVARRDSVVLIRGARQMGKTSLLARGLHRARASGARVVLMDLQKLNAADFANVETFFRTLGDWLADELDLPVSLAEVWQERRGPSVNFERFVRREVLARLPSPLAPGGRGAGGEGALVWAIDEADRLFPYAFGSEVFGLFRSWHNARVLDPASSWSQLTLAIAYATEAHLFITDMNQSPFNIGTLLSLEDFNRAQVAELNAQYGGPLRGEAEVEAFHGLVGGHPYLTNRGLYHMVHRNLSLAAFQAQADRDDGIFGDHLRRILVVLARDPALADVVRGVLNGKPCPTPESFYRLRSAGLMAGDSARDVRLRCRLYALYLGRHLM
jgi:hypothetical protein